MKALNKLSIEKYDQYLKYECVLFKIHYDIIFILFCFVLLLYCFCVYYSYPLISVRIQYGLIEFDLVCIYTAS